VIGESGLAISRQGGFASLSLRRGGRAASQFDLQARLEQTSWKGRAFDTGFSAPHIEAMTIGLAKDVEDFLQEQVQAGICADASHLVNDVLRSLRDQQSKPFVVTPGLEAWLLQAADHAVRPLKTADFTAIRKRAKARLKSLHCYHVS
jgi:Arc/MetJ-type ribon-helix-helix transcriptional regulator